MCVPVITQLPQRLKSIYYLKKYFHSADSVGAALFRNLILASGATVGQKIKKKFQVKKTHDIK